MRREVTEDLKAAITEMPVVNHHEHAWRSFSVEHGVEFDLPGFLCQGYLVGDLAAAGLQLGEDAFAYLDDASLQDGSEAVWERVLPFLAKVRNTCTFRYLLAGLQDLFAVEEEDIFSARWREASQRIRDYSRANKGKGGNLSERMGVRATVLDAKLQPEELGRVDGGKHCVLHVGRLDCFIHEERGLAAELRRQGGRGFSALLDAFDARFRAYLEAGAAGFKSGLAYNRRIAYGDVTKEEAAKVFKKGVLSAPAEEKTRYQDFMMNRLCRLCTEAAVPLQIHTGVQAGTGHVLEDTRPTLLTSLFQRHGDLRVDLFHGGYPWCVQAGLLAKYFPNVYIDGCWLSHISSTGYRQALRSWIETVPMSKILAWGGDHHILEQSYGALAWVRDLVAETLGEMVTCGHFDMGLAIEAAERILYRNGEAFWGIGEGRDVSGNANEKGR